MMVTNSVPEFHRIWKKKTRGKEVNHRQRQQLQVMVIVKMQIKTKSKLCSNGKTSFVSI
jgi:hypothetical protein